MSAISRAGKTDELLERAAAGERRALGRLLSLVEQGGQTADEIAELVHGRAPGTAPVIGITGAPGSGKSTLVGHLIAEMTGTAEKAGVAGSAEKTGTHQETGLGGRPTVLAVDPTSPLTGGAILGDRIRMDVHKDVHRDARRDVHMDVHKDVHKDGITGDRAFIRSMATRGHAGGLALAVPAALRLFEVCNYRPLLVETVGIGQVEVDVTRAADTTVVLVAPGMGDAVQANKAGLLEVADVLVVNKADRPGAEDTRRDLEHMLDLGRITGLAADWRPEIIMTTATTGAGAAAVHRAIEAHRAHLAETGQLEARRHARIRQEVLDRVAQDLDAAAVRLLSTQPAELQDALEGHKTPVAAAAEITGRLLGDQPQISPNSPPAAEESSR